MAINFYNTRLSRKVPFEPGNPPEVRVYSCGPTVYDFAHIGNFRSYVFVDILRRFLRFSGYQVDHAMNITDVDDKTIRRSREAGESLGDFTNKYTDEFFRDLEKLRIHRFEHHPRATHSLPAMFELIGQLDKKGYTYQAEGSTYFNISKFGRYGKLSHISMEGIQSGARYDADEYQKDDVRDFVLWKAPKEDNEDTWDSPFGPGRPGWHLECSAMIRDIFGAGGIDIHTGGVDLIFPHHENEIAQSEAAWEKGENFVRYWLHNEHLLVDGKKMSKSLGNFHTLRDLEERPEPWVNPRTIRYVLSASHYRSKLNFTFEGLEAAAHSLERLDNCVSHLMENSMEAEQAGARENLAEKFAKIAHFETDYPTGLEEELQHKETDSKTPEDYLTQFTLALRDDLNTPRALAALFEAVKRVNNQIHNSGDKLTGKDAAGWLAFFQKTNEVLAFMDFPPATSGRDTGASGLEPEQIDALVAERRQAKKDKNFDRADEIRDDLKGRGIVIEDTPQGPRWKLEH